MSDLLFALRQLWKSPGFTFVAIFTVAIGIGANTAIFSVVNAVLLKPLPFPQPGQLVGIGSADNREVRTSGGLDSLSFPDFVDLRAQNRTLANVAAYHDRTFALTGVGEAQSVRGQRVSGEFFDVLGLKPVLGRTFTRAEEAGGGGADGLTIVLSYEFWQRQFRGEASVLGQVLMLDAQPVFDIRTMQQRVEETWAAPRLLTFLLGVFAALALLLAVVGIYGVMAYNGVRRMREIGVRLALGARRRQIIGMMLEQGLRLLALGLVIGFLGALATSRVLRSLLFEVSPTDPLRYAGVALLPASVAALACWIPARRASRVDPMITLRAE